MEELQIQDARKTFIQETAEWLSQQIEHVWNALDMKNAKNSDRELKVKHKGKYTYYHFIYQGKFCAEAMYYFDTEEGQWMFELTDVAKEYFSQIHDYFTKRKN